MKKLFILCLSVALTVSVCGCAAETKPPAGDVTTTTATTTASTTTTKRTGSTTTTTTTTTTEATTVPTVTTTQPTTAPTTTVPTGSTTAPTGSTTAKPTLQTKPTVSVPVYEIPAEELAEKVYSTATIEDDFEEQVVLIALHKSVSADNHLFTVEEFRDMFGIEIVEATPIFYIEKDSGANVNWDAYRQIYKLTIPQSGKQAVLDAIKIIEQHPYVWSADVNGYYYTE